MAVFRAGARGWGCAGPLGGAAVRGAPARRVGGVACRCRRAERAEESTEARGVEKEMPLTAD